VDIAYVDYVLLHDVIPTYFVLTRPPSGRCISLKEDVTGHIYKTKGLKYVGNKSPINLKLIDVTVQWRTL
jgi:hypothetical protein